MQRLLAVRTLMLMTLLIAMLAACGSPEVAAPSGTTLATTPEPVVTSAAPAASTTAPATETAVAASAVPVGSTTDQGACTTAAASAARPNPLVLEIGTGNTGGVFFPYGGGIAKVLTDKLPGAQVTAQETGGSVDNMKLILANEADIGMSTVDSAYDGILGQGAYQDTGAIPACSIAVLYQSFVHVVARDGTNINTVADMKGKTISVGSAGSSTEGAADRVLEAAGLNPKTDITRENLSVNDSVAAMKDQKIDAFFWIGGLPTSAVTDLITTGNTKVKFVPTGQFVESLTAKYGPVYTAFSLPKGVYKGFDDETPGIGIGNILFVSASMNEQLAYDIVKTLFDNLELVQASHPAAKDLKLESAVIGSSIPFHPGAVRFYQEQGILK